LLERWKREWIDERYLFQHDACTKVSKVTVVIVSTKYLIL